MNRTHTLLVVAMLLGLSSACGDHGHSHDQSDGQGHADRRASVPPSP